MKDLFVLQNLKYAGAAVIVLTAFALMFPQIVGFAFSLARLGTFVTIVMVVSLLLALGCRFLKKKQAKNSVQSEETGST